MNFLSLKRVSPRTLAKMAGALEIEAYELLKPETTVPDNAVNVIEKYTVDVYQRIGKALEELQKEYKNLSRQKTKNRLS
jgi:hypothetical protein